MRYRIVAKRDFGNGPGFWINRQWVKTGFVVTDGFCNIMPGAAWFRTVADAMDALAILIEAKHDGPTFWNLYRTRKIAT